MALGLGEMSLDSYLNEPLKAQVDLLNIGGLHEDQIKIRLATSDDFKKMGVDRAYFLTSISFDVEIDDDGRARILITSEDPVLEPYLDFILEARWPSGRLLREYTVLVDPPVFDDTNPVISASSRVAEVDEEAEPSKKKQTVSTSGTRVDIRDSKLAPGAMPSRAFNSSTAEAPAPGSRYMIHRDDTLWRIASRATPGNASVYQTMLDIQRLNPDAFIDGNINLIKAGYIIYLPTEKDISSGTLSEALAEVREQNQAWREDRTSESGQRGPSLRISAEPEDGGSSAEAATGAAGVAAGDAAMEDMEKEGLERAELEQRLASMEQQVETLQRIVSLKDDQIAALQDVIAGETDAAAVDMAGSGSAEAGAPEAEATEPAASAPAADSEVELEVVETDVIVEPEPEPAAAVEPAPAQAAAEPAPGEESGGLFSNLWLALGAVVIAILGIFYIRRRGGREEEGAEPAAAPAGDAFANVKLREQALEVEEAAPVPEASDTPIVEEDEIRAPAAGHRGYGERKHDEYASDEASDALAEAEIYVAYGRFPQAIDLLKNALVNDPDNADYRLKLLQLYVETGDRSAAEQELAELELIGDSDSLAAGRAALNGSGRGASPVGGEPGTELLTDYDDSLESDFAGLEIEEPDTAGGSLEDDLDLSADFEGADSLADSGDEDLVIAADSNGLSTKLDLARAYMDMGDEDGARQILEEVAAEGNEELQAEARALLERIG